MKKGIFCILTLLLVVSCDTGRKSALLNLWDTYDEWVDSIKNTKMSLSFRNIQIGGQYGAKDVNLTKEDTAHICFSNKGTIMEDNNVHYTISTFRGRVYKIFIETDGLDTYNFVQNTYLKRIGCPIEAAMSAVPTLCDPDYFSQEPDFELAAFTYSNGALTFSRKGNTKKKVVAIDREINVAADNRFNNSSIYCISITDSILYRQYRRYKNWQLKNKKRKENIERQQKEEYLKRQDEISNTKYENQL